MGAQEQTLTGTIIDTDGIPIENVNILVLGSSKGVSSDANGKYVIDGLDGTSYFIQFSYLGYQTSVREVNIDDDPNVLDIVLEKALDRLNEVTVTANRRLQAIDKTPLSISSVSTKQVEQLQIRNLNEINNIAPNFRSYDDGANGSFALISSRGISTFGTDPVIGLYVDDVPYFSTFAFPLALTTVEQIQVLRGPQGTLYGRNALAGVVKITSKKPTNTLTGFASLGRGNLNSRQLAFGISAPLVKNKLFLDTNADISERDVFVTYVANGCKYWRSLD